MGRGADDTAKEINAKNMNTELVAQMWKNYQSNVLFNLEGKESSRSDYGAGTKTEMGLQRRIVWRNRNSCGICFLYVLSFELKRFSLRNPLALVGDLLAMFVRW